MAGLRGLTFELTPRAEAGAVSRGGDDSTAGAGPAYSACRSESGVERVVRPPRTQPMTVMRLLELDLDHSDATAHCGRRCYPVLRGVLHRGCVIYARWTACHDLKILRCAADDVVPYGHQAALALGLSFSRDGACGKWLAGR